MCGISGILHFDQRPVDSDLLRRMNDTMVHRGPDGSGLFVNGPIGLGHRRLSIIDLHTGDQPMATPEGDVQVVFNGEIYNFLEIKAELEKRGHVFRTRSDTETLLHGYREWGENFVDHLRGMFAIALWDTRAQKLLLVRDRLGKKPLYYYFDGARLVFGSEMKALLADPSIPRDLDARALDAYLSFGYVPSPLSIFQGIRKLPPAHLAVCADGRLDIRSYWDLDMSHGGDDISEAQAVEELREVFDASVRLRMISDVPLGAFLSGGVDSSAVVAAMAGMTSEPVRTAAIGFAEKRFNELEYARVVAERYGTDHGEFVVEPDALGILDRLVWHFDEPFADSSAIPTWYVSQMARRKVTVALSGDGGDETFAGYTQRYAMNRFENDWRNRIPGFVRRGLLGPLAACYPRADFLPRPLRLKSFMTNLSLPVEQAYFRDMSFYFKPEAKTRLLLPEIAEAVRGGAEDYLGRYFARNINPDVTSRVQYVDIKSYLPEDILVKVDRMSMAHSLEVRAPILDHRVMEYAARLPSRLKLRGNEGKYIFKKMNETRLPHDILYRKKQGFCVPLAAWLRGGLKDKAQEAVFGKTADLGELFDMNYVAGLWDRHQSGREDNATPIWGLVMLGLWREMVKKTC
ncbi:asparagine synthase (glutamine-hydrolyzing) [Geoalkalibacter halelectricus]|uniref:asparagine synthase (glutamine-hydrolyzing) n=1 Tax=Geoalkalibacter halelectricus TaxID=2847045 RepID=A0ABY5ZJJ2_9BACT|nr:asparagine synthase (glutamine-hydrolyzing) [Geoalkalibacter halelectricus]MDO3379759.1 asparagine synthase (glutamine-hydrolyzing) [Geoalkalibacter halelectricus]UWZ79291.1 asparagine synthase (glutamine-hydrolyzing) [Geoalkalibacter halelectricus]